MKKQFIAFMLLMISSTFLFAQEHSSEDSVTITIIRKGNFAGSANKWKIWLNGEELCKLKNSSYCEVTIAKDEINLNGTAVGIGTAVGFQWALQKTKSFKFDNLNQTAYFFKAKLAAEKGKQFVEFTKIKKEDAQKLLIRAKKRCDLIEMR